VKFVNWNCNGAFRNKYLEIASLDADIYIIQECENPALSNHKDFLLWAKNYLWLGDNKNKGIGVFAKEHIILEPLDWNSKYEEHEVKLFLPVLINKKFQLLSVWTHKNNSPNFGYIGQFWKYLKTNKEKFEDIIIVGDLNSNSIWDQWDRWWNHSDVINELKECEIESVYHFVNNEEQGKEKTPTFFLYRNIEKGYHIDYFLIKSKWLQKIEKYEVKERDYWLKYSDHLPQLLDIRI
jgi:exonuclease III